MLFRTFGIVLVCIVCLMANEPTVKVETPSYNVFKVNKENTSLKQGKTEESKLKITENILAKEAFKIGYNYINSTSKVDIFSKEFEKALVNLEEAVRQEPMNVEYNIAYAVLLLELKDVENAQILAEELLTKVKLITPNDLKVDVLLIQALFNQQQYHTVLEHIKYVVEKDQTLLNEPSLVTTFNLSSIFVAEHENSIGYLQNTVIRYPQNYGAKIGLLTLYNTMRETAFIKEKKSDLKDELKYIYQKYNRKLHPNIRQYIENLLQGELS